MFKSYRIDKQTHTPTNWHDWKQSTLLHYHWAGGHHVSSRHGQGTGPVGGDLLQPHHQQWADGREERKRWNHKSCKVIINSQLCSRSTKLQFGTRGKCLQCRVSPENSFYVLVHPEWRFCQDMLAACRLLHGLEACAPMEIWMPVCHRSRGDQYTAGFWVSEVLRPVAPVPVNAVQLTSMISRLTFNSSTCFSESSFAIRISSVYSSSSRCAISHFCSAVRRSDRSRLLARDLDRLRPPIRDPAISGYDDALANDVEAWRLFEPCDVSSLGSIRLQNFSNICVSVASTSFARLLNHYAHFFLSDNIHVYFTDDIYSVA